MPLKLKARPLEVPKFDDHERVELLPLVVEDEAPNVSPLVEEALVPTVALVDFPTVSETDELSD